MKVKCDICKKEIVILDNQFDPERSFVFSLACEGTAKENLLRAIFGGSEVAVKNTERDCLVPTAKELEFLEAEMDLLIKDHRVEDSANAMDKLFELTHEMMERGIVEKNPEGIKKAWDAIFSKQPEIKYHVEKCTSVLF